MTLVKLQLHFGTYSSEVTDYNECKGAPYSTCALPSSCPVDVANVMLSLYMQVLQVPSGRLYSDCHCVPKKFPGGCIEHKYCPPFFQAKTILVRTQQGEPDYDGKAETMSLITMLHDNLQLPHTEDPIMLHAGFFCMCPDSEGSRGAENFQGNASQTGC